MNYRNQKLVAVIRIVTGVLFFLSGISGLLGGKNMQGVPAPMVSALQVLLSTGIFQMIKTTEMIAGLMLVINFLPALAAIFLAPICIGVIVFNANIAPAFIMSGVVVSALNAFLGYAYWEKYKALFDRSK
jgi:uncharacterized membrane protein YphA (DoxX/SURF4 family)